MASAIQSNSILDTPLARVISLVIALLLAFLLWSNWSSDFTDLFSSSGGSSQMISASEPAKPNNPALEACLEKRVGDVEQMKSDGIISDAQYEAFRSRAEGLCRAQNPS